MTQEELDAMMEGDLEETEDDFDNEQELQEKEDVEEVQLDSGDYRVSATSQWPPPPPTEDHKVVHQLDEVTADSEEKAGKVFDVLEHIASASEESEELSGNIKDELIAVKEVFEKLSESFPHIATFKAELARNQKILDYLNEIEEKAQSINDQTMIAMDVMQYQDIHRQKIERVINVMRALSRYMSQLFEGKLADEKRVGSAVHLHGDDTTEDVVDEDDIEALIASFGKK